MLGMGLGLAVQLGWSAAEAPLVCWQAGVQTQHPLALYRAVVQSACVLVQHPDRISAHTGLSVPCGGLLCAGIEEECVMFAVSFIS